MVRRLVCLIVGCALASGILAWYIHISPPPGATSSFVPEYRYSTGRFDVLASRADGAGYAILVRNPTLAPPFSAGADETAYRAARPFESWIGWVFALGHARDAARGVYLAAVLAAGIMVLVGSMFAERIGVAWWWGFACVALPGAIVSVGYGGGDLWAAAFVLLGLAVLPRWRLAAVCFAAAALSRETALLAPVAVGIYELARARRVRWWLALPPTVLGSWIIFVHSRVGAWPWNAASANSQTRLGYGLSNLLADPSNAFVLGILVACVISAWAHRQWLSAFVASVFFVFAFTLGPSPASYWGHFARILLPGYTVALLAGCPRLGSTKEMSPATEAAGLKEATAV